MLKASGYSLPELVNDGEEICAVCNVRCVVKNTVQALHSVGQCGFFHGLCLKCVFVFSICHVNSYGSTKRATLCKIQLIRGMFLENV